MLDFIYSLFSKKDKEEVIIAPCVGDIVEFEDGQRSMVMCVDLKEEMYDVRFSKGVTRCVTQKGRQKSLVEISRECEPWPPKNGRVYRDSMLIYPVKQWRISILNWLSKKILK